MVGGAAAAPAATASFALPNAPQLRSSFAGQRITVTAPAAGLKVRRQHVVRAKGTGWLKLGRQAGEDAAGTVKRTAEKGGTGLFKRAQQVAKEVRSGTQSIKLGTQKLSLPVPGLGRVQRRDNNVVFVAGATGKLGARVVRELVKQGFKVRAGVPDLQKAKELFQLAVSYELLKGQEVKNVSLVEADLSDEESIAEAIGNAGKVVAVGEAEAAGNKAAVALIEKAKEMAVSQFVLLSSGSAPKPAFSFFNFFQGSSAQPERVLQESGMAFSVVKAGGLESTSDALKETTNVRLAASSAAVTGVASRLQVAEVISSIIANPSVSENKVLEVIADEAAPSRSLEDLLKEVPVAGLTQAQRAEQARKEEEERIRAEEEAERTAREAEESARQEERQRQMREEAEATAREAAEEAKEASARQAELEAEAKEVAARKAKVGTKKQKAAAEVDLAQRTIRGVADQAEKLGGLSALPNNGRGGPKATPIFSFNPFQAVAEKEEEPKREPEPVKKKAPAFNLGSLFSKLSSETPEPEEVKGKAQKAAGEAKKAAFSFGAAAKSAANSTAGKTAPTVSKKVTPPKVNLPKPKVSIPKPKIPVKPRPEPTKQAGAQAKKRNIGTLFGKVKEEEYLYED